MARQAGFVHEETEGPPNGPLRLVRLLSPNQQLPYPELPFRAGSAGKINHPGFHPGGQGALEQAGLSQSVVKRLNQPKNRPIKPLATLEEIEGSRRLPGYRQGAALPLDGRHPPQNFLGRQNPVIHVRHVVTLGDHALRVNGHHPVDHLSPVGIPEKDHVPGMNGLGVAGNHQEGVPRPHQRVHADAPIKYLLDHVFLKVRPGRLQSVPKTGRSG